MTEDVVSNIAPPVITCPSCEGMLPSELGLVTCVLCSVQVRAEHEPTRRAWVKEKVACPSCNSVLVAGADNRPARLRCGSCGDSFTLLRARPKVDIHCPSCEAHLGSHAGTGDRTVDCLRSARTQSEFGSDRVRFRHVKRRAAARKTTTML